MELEVMRGGGELDRSLGSEFLSGRAACDRGACFASRPFSPWHVAAPVEGLYFPSPQSSHVASLVAPVDVLYFPSPQSSQAERRFEEVGLYLPASQE